MKTFKREGKGIRNWTRNNEELLGNLEEIRNGICGKEEMEIFLLKTVKDVDISEGCDMAFWAYDEPSSMPADARCDFVYWPTYLTTLAMIGIINKYPEFMNLSGVEEILRYSLNACAGRGLQGHGHESYEGFCENILLFMRNGIVKFMKDWPLFSVRFEEVIRNGLNQIERDYASGNHAAGWGGKECRETQEEIIRLRNEVVQA